MSAEVASAPEIRTPYHSLHEWQPSHQVVALTYPHIGDARPMMVRQRASAVIARERHQLNTTHANSPQGRHGPVWRWKVESLERWHAIEIVGVPPTSLANGTDVVPPVPYPLPELEFQGRAPNRRLSLNLPHRQILSQGQERCQGQRAKEATTLQSIDPPYRDGLRVSSCPTTCSTLRCSASPKSARSTGDSSRSTTTTCPSRCWSHCSQLTHARRHPA